ncbi:hypothetical protein EJB05_13109, partial [Eragrostis curvula]
MTILFPRCFLACFLVHVFIASDLGTMFELRRRVCLMEVDEAMESTGTASAMFHDVSGAHKSTQPTKKQQKRKRASTELSVVDNVAASTEIQKKKDWELKHMKVKAEKEEKRIERENKRLKKLQEEAEREKKRREKEQAELKQQACIKRQANIMERFLKTKTNSKMDNSGGQHAVRTTCSVSSENTGEIAIAATSAIDCTLSQAKVFRVEDLWLAHVDRWRKLAQKLCHWGVRRSPKIQLFHELKLQKSSTSAPSDEMLLTPTKEQPSQENPRSLDFSTLLDELKTPSYGNNKMLSKAIDKSSSSSVLFTKKLLQFDGSYRPSYYGIWRNESSTVRGRHPFNRDPDLNYEVDSDEEWEEEDPGERLSDFEKDDEEIMNEQDSRIDAAEETENSFVVPNGYLSDDEGVQYEPLSGTFDDTCSILGTSGITVEELNVLLQGKKALNSFTEHALRKDRPLVISNLDHRKDDLLKAEDITGILKVEKLCLQALCMRKYPGGPIIDVPTNVNVSLDDQKFFGANNSTPVALKSISDLDMPEFVKLVTSCPGGMGKLVDLLLGRFPCVSKAQLKKKIREIAEFTHNRWQVKKDILDRYCLSFSPDTNISAKHGKSSFSQCCPPPDASGKSGVSSPDSTQKFELEKQQIDDQDT